MRRLARKPRRGSLPAGSTRVFALRTRGAAYARLPARGARHGVCGRARRGCRRPQVCGCRHCCGSLRRGGGGMAVGDSRRCSGGESGRHPRGSRPYGFAHLRRPLRGAAPRGRDWYQRQDHHRHAALRYDAYAGAKGRPAIDGGCENRRLRVRGRPYHPRPDNAQRLSARSRRWR